jgi:mannose-1-phosphate guanylyltransferase
MKIVPVILAGGQGTRFWPVSRKKLPKQFLSISDDGRSLIRRTADRAIKIAKSDLMVVTTEPLRELVSEHVPEARVIVEPEARNTAASIGLAVAHLKDLNDIMVVLPSDHVVENEEVFSSLLLEAANLANTQPLLVTFGIKPTSPNTGYGYIRRGGAINGFENAFFVRRFFEKPNLERARDYVNSGDYLWNSGMFAWSGKSILAAIEDEMPLLYQGVLKIRDAIGSPDEVKVTKEVFSDLENISIDFGVLEHVKNTAVIQASDFGWNDVGAWDSWAQYFSEDSAGNKIEGDAVTVESTGCIIKSKGRHVAVLGVKDLVVIETDDATLVCPRDRVQDVKKVVEVLNEKKREDLL